MTAMKLVHESLVIATRGRGLYDITAPLNAVIAAAGAQTGLCTVFIQHTSASLVVQENADPSVLRDLENWIEKVAPEDPTAYEHDDEGPDDMPAHLRSAITRTSESIPVRGGRLAFGTWQAMYVWEHRRKPHQRTVLVSLIVG
jgi:secondary thiamine-phosphate synthase enzyme